MTRPTARVALAWGLFVTAIAPGVLSAQSPSSSTTTVTVQNERNEHVTVYIEQMGNPVAGNVDFMNARIGDVAPGSTNTFNLPDWAMARPEGDLTFIIQVEGEGELAPVEMAVQEGDDLGIIVVEQDDLMETLAAPTVEPGEASVSVLNNRGAPVLVLIEEVVHGRGSPVHILIGTASPNSDTTLPIPGALVREGQELRFVLHPVGGMGDLPTQVVRLDEEDRVEIIVPE